jgi:hypothetical protein
VKEKESRYEIGGGNGRWKIEEGKRRVGNGKGERNERWKNKERNRI